MPVSIPWLLFHFRYIIEALDEVDDLETPSESSDQESLPGQLKLLKALSMSSCTSGPSSTTSDDVIIEGKIMNVWPE